MSKTLPFRWAQARNGSTTPDDIVETISQNEQIQQSIWSLRDAVERMNRNIELLLEERTRPDVQAVKVEAVEVEPVQAKPTTQTIRVKNGRWATAVELINKSVIKMGGTKMVVQKYNAGLLNVSCNKCPVGTLRNAHYYGRVNFTDHTLPKAPKGGSKQFSVNCRSEQEYFEALDHLSTIFGMDFRSIYA